MLKAKMFAGAFLFYLTLPAQTPDTLKLFVADQTLYEGHSYSFPVYSTNFKDIVAFQFTLSLSTELVDSADLFLDNLRTPNTFFYWKKEYNQVGLSWPSPDGKGFSVDKDSSLFSIYLKMKKTAQVKDLIAIPNKGYVISECLYFPPNATDFTPIGISLNYSPDVTALVLASQNPSSNNDLIEISPNPIASGNSIKLKSTNNINFYQWINSEGKQLSDQLELNNQEIRIPSEFKNGNYFIQFYNKNKLISKLRVMVINP